MVDLAEAVAASLAHVKRSADSEAGNFGEEGSELLDFINTLGLIPLHLLGRYLVSFMFGGFVVAFHCLSY